MFGTNITVEISISTHTLTWSVTYHRDIRSAVLFISTHTLTWSVTVLKVVVDTLQGISTHTLTWSVTLPTIRQNIRSCYFNSHAHVERDGVV